MGVLLLVREPQANAGQTDLVPAYETDYEGGRIIARLHRHSERQRRQVAVSVVRIPRPPTYQDCMLSRAAENRCYATRRTLLILLMGSKCKYCSERCPWLLEFHHTKKRSWSAAKTSRNHRIRLYMQDYSNGMLVLACGRCNKKLGSPPGDEDPLPF